MTWAPVPVPDLGCQRGCVHGTTGACASPDVAGRRAPVPFDAARASGGACGPEAEYMHFPSWPPRGTPAAPYRHPMWPR